MGYTKDGEGRLPYCLRMLQPSGPQPWQPPPAVYPEGIQDGKEHDADPWIVKVHILGMISMSPGSCSFPYREKHAKHQLEMSSFL